MEKAPGDGGLLGDDTVAEGSQALHPAGQPISASTKAGFNCRVPGEVGGPPGGVTGSGRPGIDFSDLGREGIPTMAG